MKILILVTNDQESDEVKSLYSMDFCMELRKPGDIVERNDVQEYVKRNLKGALLLHVLESPKSHEDLKSFPLRSDSQYFEIIDIVYDYACFAKFLPRLGYVANLLSVICGAAIVFMSLTVATTNKHENSMLVLNCVGTILTALVNYIMFLYSGAPQNLTYLGNYFDEVLFNKCKNILNISNTHADNLTKKRIISTIVYSCVAANTVIITVSAYQQNITIMDEFLKTLESLDESEREQLKKILQWLVVNMIALTGAYAAMAFQSSFAVKLVEDIMNRLKPSNENIDRNRADQTSSRCLLFSSCLSRTNENIDRNRADQTSSRCLLFSSCLSRNFSNSYMRLENHYNAEQETSHSLSLFL